MRSILICMALFLPLKVLAADRCASDFASVQKIVRDTIGQDIDDGSVFKEKATDGRPVTLVFNRSHGAVQVKLVNVNHQVLGNYVPQICGRGKTLTMALNNREVTITKVGESLHTSYIPFMGELTFGAEVTR